MPGWLNQLLYLVSAVLFIIGLKRLGSPATARQGNMISGVGMLIAILVTLLDHAIVSYGVIVAGMVVGTALGVWQAYAVKMTAMPQMVALLNGFGGGASMIVGAAEFLRAFEAGTNIPTPTGIVMQLSLIIGARDTHRQPRGVRKAAGVDVGQADHVSGPERLEPDRVPRRAGAGGLADFNRSSPDAALLSVSAQWRCCSACCS